MTEFADVLAPVEQEGTKAVVRAWLKQVGDPVAFDDPLVELETDKVTQEVPSPVAGILEAILVSSGDEARPGTILGRIRVASVSAAGAAGPVPGPVGNGRPDPVAATGRFSPAVRRAADLYDIDPGTVAGTGRGGRVTRADMDAAHAAPSQSPAPASGKRETETETGIPRGNSAGQVSRMVPHSPIRLAIARHMLESVTVAPHVTAVFEADFTAIARHRAANKDKLAAEGINLSYTAYIIAASAAAMRKVPEINSRWHADRLEIFDDVNIGIGTSLGDKGLVAPVIRQVQHLSLSGIAAKLQDITARGRAGMLAAADLQGGTFTISNHGVSGSLVAAPIIINQPQSAILGVGKLEKRVVVREVDGIDTMQIRPMAYVSLTIDHRALDGHQTNGWLTHFVEALENWPR